MGKKVITANDIQKAAESGNKRLHLKKEECIITPGALDKIQELGMEFSEKIEPSESCGSQPDITPHSQAPAISAADDLKQNAPLETQETQSITDHVCTILQDKLPEMSPDKLTTIVKNIVESKFSGEQPGNASDNSSPVKMVAGVSLIHGDVLLDEDSGPSLPGKVQISDAIRCHDDTHLTATYIKWEKTSFSRTVESTEISIIIEGELQLKTDGQSMDAKAGDIFYLSKGACVEYTTPSMVKLACISS